ncbi:MAG: glycosyltransferase WbsX family protein [Cetobacterium sp.]
MKIIAYYLPQYHETKENNEWWGKGFTEWTNVKKMKPLYSKHEQPKIPLNNNYYDLLKKETLENQAKLAKEYNIHGFAIYHYWFEGDRLLDKPLENLLKYKDIDVNYCLFWANHSWIRSWEGKSTILKEQKYGNELEWEEHFIYLNRFFQDTRYIKVKNKPMFLVYKASEIKRFNDRVEYLNKRCKEVGFDGIHIVESAQHHKKFEPQIKSNAVLYSEPAYTMSQNSIYLKLLHKLFRKINLTPMKYDGNKILNKLLIKNKKYNVENNYLGLFNGWDNTPRHQKRGYVISKVNPENFRKILKQQKKWLETNNEEFIFYNAWNEWAEGMCLEPDSKDKYEYLKIIKEISDKD